MFLRRFLRVPIIYVLSRNKENNGEAVLTSTHNLCFEMKYKKYQTFYLKTFRFFLC